MSQDREYHRPVMADEVAEMFRRLRGGVLVDATFGGGGHSRRLRRELGSSVRIVAIDRDPAAAANAEGLEVDFVEGDFGDLAGILDRAGVASIAGALFDFGVSSRQLDEPERGFSYHAEGPLDMRMDQRGGMTAADLVNDLPERELARIIAEYGEDPSARRIARAIVGARPLHGTSQLAEVVASAVPAALRRRPGHPARRTFQALRIAVNGELDAIRTGLDTALERLAPGGRCVAISYHSLEDRIVKRRFADAIAGCTCPPELPVCVCGADPDFQLVTRKPVSPTAGEVEENPRARSARLRAIARRPAA
jgi:16S rRNA (cytosine1402-N4)-methyltransferase